MRTIREAIRDWWRGYTDEDFDSAYKWYYFFIEICEYTPYEAMIALTEQEQLALTLGGHSA